MQLSEYPVNRLSEAAFEGARCSLQAYRGRRQPLKETRLK